MRIDARLQKALKRINATEVYDLLLEAISSYLNGQKLQLRKNLALALECRNLVDEKSNPKEYHDAFLSSLAKFRKGLSICLDNISKEDIERYNQYLQRDNESFVGNAIMQIKKMLINSSITVDAASQANQKLAVITKQLTSVKTYVEMKSYLIGHIQEIEQNSPWVEDLKYHLCLLALAISSVSGALLITASMLYISYGPEYAQKWLREQIESICGKEP